VMHDQNVLYKKVIISDDNKLLAAISTKRMIRIFHLD